ncbi:MAG TPA: hypothetical protein VH000_04070 [Rhizomicrobium sp.]|jgi:hypothetical protein|nr:hypothetical protein [Rhizomicrobium sp.]HEX4533386.1 hypothetical protein [Rhizomicrobium sp.]
MRFVLSMALAALTVTAAQAGADVMNSRFGNTTVATNSAGVQTKIYYNADGTYTAKQGDLATKGRWNVTDDGKLCLTFDQQPADARPICAPVEMHNAGDTWSANGQSVTLMPGIH